MDKDFYAEWVFYSNDQEKEEAIIYLNLWKKFFLKKIGLELLDEQFVDRPKFCDQIATLGIKIQTKRNVSDET